MLSCEFFFIDRFIFSFEQEPTPVIDIAVFTFYDVGKNNLIIRVELYYRNIIMY